MDAVDLATEADAAGSELSVSPAKSELISAGDKGAVQQRKSRLRLRARPRSHPLQRQSG